VLFAFGILTFFCLVPSPDMLGLPMPEEENQPSDSIISSEIGEKCSIFLLLCV